MKKEIKYYTPPEGKQRREIANVLFQASSIIDLIPDKEASAIKLVTGAVNEILAKSKEPKVFIKLIRKPFDKTEHHLFILEGVNPNKKGETFFDEFFFGPPVYGFNE